MFRPKYNYSMENRIAKNIVVIVCFGETFMSTASMMRVP